MQFSVLFSLVFCLAVSARPTRRAAFTLKNGQDAIALNNEFKDLTPNSPCNSGDNACVNGEFAQCDGGKFVLTPCPSGTVCAALPLVNKAGTSVSCDSQSDVDARIAATGASGGGNSTSSDTSNNGNKKSNNNNNGQNGGGSQDPPNQDSGNNGNDQQGGNNGDIQQSRTLDQSVIADGFNNDGQNPPVDGQKPSLTSSNNFINFCATSKDLPITNGQQIKTGSCNPAPMGEIPSTDHMPSSKFVFPKNMATIKANKSFTVKMAIRELQTGNFVNANENYFSAPQQLEGNGQIKGHSHVVIEKLSALDQTDPTDPNVFAFFKGLNEQEQDGILTAAVDNGLPEGVYKISSINTAANHQPVVVPIAQHGSLDDVVYFTVTASGKS
jgi:hypothetical protein